MVKCKRCHKDITINTWISEDGLCETCYLTVECMQEKAALGYW